MIRDRNRQPAKLIRAKKNPSAEKVLADAEKSY